LRVIVRISPAQTVREQTAPELIARIVPEPTARDEMAPMRRGLLVRLAHLMPRKPQRRTLPVSRRRLVQMQKTGKVSELPERRRKIRRRRTPPLPVQMAGRGVPDVEVVPAVRRRMQLQRLRRRVRTELALTEPGQKVHGQTDATVQSRKGLAQKRPVPTLPARIV